MRALEKYAVRAGGAMNHRFGLNDGILIKDNHVRLAGGVGEAVRRMRAAGRTCRSRWRPRASMRSTRRSTPARTSSCSTTCRPRHPRSRAAHPGRAKTEISGGVTLARLPELAATGADYVSIGALTHSAPAVDLSFELEPDA